MKRTLTVAVALSLLSACDDEPRGNPPPMEIEKNTVASFVSPAPADPGLVWTHADRDIRAGEITAAAGPDHCDWQTATYLGLSWPVGTVAPNGSRTRQYFRDPQKVVMRSGPIGRTLPADAQDTGYRSGDLQLWLSESDPGGAFLRVGTDVERWPRADPMILCS